MQAMTFMLPPQTRQVSMSISNTRFKRCARLIATWLATSVASDAATVALLPRRHRLDQLTGVHHRHIVDRVGCSMLTPATINSVTYRKKILCNLSLRGFCLTLQAEGDAALVASVSSRSVPGINAKSSIEHIAWLGAGR